jgi:SAM-dependent methyltransferase
VIDQRYPNINIEINKQSYDIIADLWKEARDQSFVSQLIIEWADRLPRSAKILDVGCGTAFPIGAYLADRGFEVIGIDVSARMLDYATALQLPLTTYVHVDFFDFETIQKFDGILAWDSFFHMPLSRQQEIYRKASHLLKEGGLLLFTHGDADNEHMNEMMGEQFYYGAMTYQNILREFKKSNLVSLEVHRDYKENGTDRSLIVLAKKNTSGQSA